MRDPQQIENGAARAGDPLEAWDGFSAAVRARLERGRAKYRDESFARGPADLLAELAEEALDLAGWGFVLWARTQSLAAQLTGRLDVDA